jgi:hypothetical protein
MGGGGGIDQVAAQTPQPRQGAIFVHADQSTISDDICNKDRNDFPGLTHMVPRPPWRRAERLGQRRPDISFGSGEAMLKRMLTPLKANKGHAKGWCVNDAGKSWHNGSLDRRTSRRRRLCTSPIRTRRGTA